MMSCVNITKAAEFSQTRFHINVKSAVNTFDAKDQRDGKGKGDGKGMVKGMLSIHVGIMLLLGHVTLSPSLHVLSSPLCCCHMSYPGCIIVPCQCRLVVIFAGVVVASLLLSLRVLVVSFLCHGLLILCLSCLSHCHPCPSCVIIVPCHWSVVVLCVSKVGWDEWRGVLTRVPCHCLCLFMGAGHSL